MIKPFSHEIFYQIFIRSFYDANGDGIGDFQGVVSKLDYLQNLGVTILLLMPVFPSPSYHGYDVINYRSVHPDYGNIIDFKKLVKESHRKNIKVILDLPVVHTSSKHPFFRDAYKNPYSTYTKWYRFKNTTNTKFYSFNNIASMPSLNHHNPAVYHYLLESALVWLGVDKNSNNSGVDGFRCDYAIGASAVFWKRFIKDVHTYKPNTIFIGEVWTGNREIDERYSSGIFDAVFNYSLYSLFFEKIPRFLNHPDSVKEELNNYLKQPKQISFINFLNTHDTDRIMSVVKNDQKKAKLVATLLFLLPSAPFIYYGEEIGMKGKKSKGPYYDEFYREPMDWYKEEKGEGMCTWFAPYNRFNKPHDGISVEEQQKPHSLLQYYKKLITIRKKYSQIIEKGSIKCFVKANILYISYRYVSSTLLCLFNVHNRPRSFSLSAVSRTHSTEIILENNISSVFFQSQEENYILKPYGSLLVDVED